MEVEIMQAISLKGSRCTNASQLVCPLQQMRSYLSLMTRGKLMLGSTEA